MIRVDFFGYSEREADLFCLLAERYEIGLRDLWEMVVKEVTLQMNETEDSRDGLLELLGGKSLNGLPLRMDTPLLTAQAAWKRDVASDADRPSRADLHGRRLGIEELVKMTHRLICWNWFWACRCPDASRRERFAEAAQLGEAEMDRLRARAQRMLDKRLRLQ